MIFNQKFVNIKTLSQLVTAVYSSILWLAGTNSRSYCTHFCELDIAVAVKVKVVS